MRFAIFYLVLALFILWRFIWPLTLSRLARGVIGALLLIPFLLELYLVSQGGLAAPEVPRLLLIAHNLLSVTLLLLGVFVLLREAIALLIALVARRATTSPARLRRDRRLALGMTLASGALSAFGVNRGIAVARVLERDMPIEALPTSLEGLTIVQISDVHASSLLREPHMAAMVERVNALNPDIIVVTGDVADGFVKRRERDVAPLAKLRARLGVFVCEGNHEHYVDYEHWVQTFPALGWRFLRNASETLLIQGTPLTIAGVTDPMAARFGRERPDPVEAFAEAPEEGVRILLAHQPKYARDYRERVRFDVQLSGHTHGGQILGMNKAIAVMNGGYVYGWYPLQGSAKLYVHSGTGLWNGFAVRLGVPSEIVRFTLRRA